MIDDIIKQDKDMGNKIHRQLLVREKYLPILIGLVIAIVHFATSFLLHPLSCDTSLEYYIAFALSVPGFVLRFIIDSLPSIPFVAFSSFFYGMMAGFLVSKGRKMQWTGILFLCSLIFVSCYLMMMAAQIFA